MSADSRDLNPSGSRAFDDPQIPPHPLEERWHMYVGGQTYGPFPGTKLREFITEGRLLPSTEVCQVGSERWTPALQDPVLGRLFQVTASPPVVTSPTLPSHVSAEKGATVVQISNHIAAPARVLIEDGIAKPKSAGTALLLSFLIVGLGQLYNGQIAKGILMMIGCLLLWIVMLGWIINIWSMIDAYINARDMNARYQRRLAAGLLA